MFPEEFLKKLANEHRISHTELEVLSLAVDGQATETIAKKLNIRSDAVRKRLSEVYKKFHIVGAGTGKLSKLQQILVFLYQEQQDLQEVSANYYQDWGEAPESDILYGRAKELPELEKWIVKERCKLVAIVGMGGIGKTTLVAKLVKQIQDKFQDEFEYVIQRSLRSAMPANNFLGNIIPLLCQQQKAKLPESTDSRISQLINYLRHHRCLLVLDDVEAILSNGVAGQYKEGYEEYGELFRQLGEEPHQSCLVLIGLEKPKEVSLLEKQKLVRSLRLEGLEPEEASEMLKSNKLSEDNDWKNLIDFYRGNPLALKIVSATIQNLFGGSVTDFMNYSNSTLVIKDINDLIYQQFQRLSELEKDLMYRIAIEQKPVPLLELQKQLFIPISPSELLEALESLLQRSLIEKKGINSFTLQPVIMEYVTNHLVEQICREIKNIDRQQKEKFKASKIQLLRNHLIKIQKLGNTKELPDSCIIKRIKDKLRTIFRSEDLIKSKLSEMQSLLQEDSPQEVGYATENVRHLLERVYNDSK